MNIEYIFYIYPTHMGPCILAWTLYTCKFVRMVPGLLTKM